MGTEINSHSKVETNTIFRFREFPVYKDMLQLRAELKKLSKERFPKEELYILRQQLWRAFDSILLNIAEGCDRHSDKDFSHFLNTALASLNEVVSCLDCALSDGYINKFEYQEYMAKSENILRQLKAFLFKVRKDDRRF